MAGGNGDDSYGVDNASDSVSELANEGIDTVSSWLDYTLGDNLENLVLLGAVNSNGIGNTLNNTLIGNAASNQLDGGKGADSLMGGNGDDSYVVDNVGDTVTELTGAGVDLVTSSVSYTLGDNVEALVLSGVGLINGFGNNLANIVTGNSAANILDGGAGADKLIGGKGNDSYVVDHIGDTVIELANEGSDTINSLVNYGLGSNQENLTLLGSSSINGTGNGLINIIIGNANANLLNGGGGSDTLVGGIGNDSYVVDNVGDKVTELTDEGMDTVSSSITYILGENLENLVLTGLRNINGTGNAFDNSLIGNTYANKLDGGLGADSLSGGKGNDSYVIDNLGDTVSEQANQGTDNVISSVSFVLGNNVENLTLSENIAINGTGNALANTLKGNGAANGLIGGAGNDTLIGFSGEDIVIGGLGKDNIVLTELTAATDTVTIVAGDSKLTSYDVVTGFALGNGSETTEADSLDLDSINIADNTANINGANAGIIKSHSISNGIISFDDSDSYASALVLTAANLTNVSSYLLSNIKTGATVAFNAIGNAYVFQDGGLNDTLVQLTGITANNLNTTGLVADGVWLV
jgi:Ca2+-binding RTX toxin-like protein